MIRSRRQAFNAAFTEERHRAYVDALVHQCGVPIELRLSETPCFFPAALIDDLTDAARAMIEQLLGDAVYRRASDEIVPARFRIPNGEGLPTFVQVDFGLVRTGDRVEGRLVELQAFPSLYGFQMRLAETCQESWAIGGVSYSAVDSIACRIWTRSVARSPAARPRRGRAHGDRSGTSEDPAGLRGHRATLGRARGRHPSGSPQGRRLFYDRDGRRTPIRASTTA